MYLRNYCICKFSGDEGTFVEFVILAAHMGFARSSETDVALYFEIDSNPQLWLIPEACSVFLLRYVIALISLRSWGAFYVRKGDFLGVIWGYLAIKFSSKPAS